MNAKIDTLILALSFYFLCLTHGSASVISTLNVAKDKPVKADTQEAAAYFAVDGDAESYWQSGASVGNHWLEMDLQEVLSIDRLVISKIEGVDSLEVRLWCEGQWQLVFAGKPVNPLIGFEPRKASRVQLKSVNGRQMRVYEVQIFQHDPQPVLVNQSGYDLHRYKRFTAPHAADGTSFIITRAQEQDVLFKGTIQQHIGDFTSFQPAQSGPYEIHLLTERKSTSVPFDISPGLIEKAAYQPAINFMVDVRCWFGDSREYHPTDEDPDCPNLGVAWRDSHQFSFEIPALLHLYFANPAAFAVDRMPVQGAYLGVRETLPDHTPEIVRLIYWAVDIYLRGAVNHTLLKEQLAYFLYAYPWLAEYIPENIYQEARDYLFAIWGDEQINRWQWYDIAHSGNLFQTFTLIGTGKGQLPPGHSIVPNLMMYEVAQREGRSDADQFFQAAYRQTEWLIENLDWHDPATTKGQRQGEPITIPALVYFLENYPQQAPKGLQEKITQWAEIAIARSQNMWDYRRYSDQRWIIPGIDAETQSAYGFNEPGNVAGFPAPALAAARVVQDQHTQEQLRLLATAHIDHVFGRNPAGRHFCFDATLDFEGVELGWFQEYQGGAGILQTARGVLDGSPKETTYPYHPYAGDPGHTEGWVTFNTAWYTGLAHWSADAISIKLYDAQFSKEINAIDRGKEVGIALTAPLNFDYHTREKAWLLIDLDGKQQRISLLETDISTGQFRGHFTVPENVKGKALKAIYGFGWHQTVNTVQIR